MWKTDGRRSRTGSRATGGSGMCGGGVSTPCGDSSGAGASAAIGGAAGALTWSRNSAMESSPGGDEGARKRSLKGARRTRRKGTGGDGCRSSRTRRDHGAEHLLARGVLGRGEAVGARARDTEVAARARGAGEPAGIEPGEHEALEMPRQPQEARLPLRGRGARRRARLRGGRGGWVNRGALALLRVFAGRLFARARDGSAMSRAWSHGIVVITPRHGTRPRRRMGKGASFWRLRKREDLDDTH